MMNLSFSKMAPDAQNPVLGDWVRVGQICLALDISVRTLNRILERFPFTELESTFISEMTEGGRQMVRVFSRRGALKLAMLSDSPKRGDVAVALFDLAEGPTKRGPTRFVASSSPAPREMVQVLDEIEVLHERGALTREIIDAYRTGERFPEAEESMVQLAAEWEEAQKLMSAANLAFRDIDRRAVRLGYGNDAVKRFVRRRKKMAQPELSFDATEGGHAGA